MRLRARLVCIVSLLVPLAAAGWLCFAQQNTVAAQEKSKSAAGETPRRTLRIIAFGAHPDDCELQTGGVAAMWSARGHAVTLVSLTNGDIGHWRMAGGPLAKRRNEEVQEAAKILGTTTIVLDNHDGELMPSLENRREVTRQIRAANADIVMSHRPNDYHPDHRYTGVLVQDAAYMVAVPFICPDVKPLKENPIFLYYYDRFETPNPFQPDIVVSIDSVVDKKLDALAVMESQFLEGGALGHAGLHPARRGASQAPPAGSPHVVRAPLRRHRRQVPQQPGAALWRRPRLQGPLRRSLRGHRIRPPANAGRIAGTISNRLRLGGRARLRPSRFRPGGRHEIPESVRARTHSRATKIFLRPNGSSLDSPGRRPGNG